jgi:hypothetical protein
MVEDKKPARKLDIDEVKFALNPIWTDPNNDVNKDIV